LFGYLKKALWLKKEGLLFTLGDYIIRPLFVELLYHYRLRYPKLCLLVGRGIPGIQSREEEEPS
jgi:hypothetical protein